MKCAGCQAPLTCPLLAQPRPTWIGITIQGPTGAAVRARVCSAQCAGKLGTALLAALPAASLGVGPVILPTGGAI